MEAIPQKLADKPQQLDTPSLPIDRAIELTNSKKHTDAGMIYAALADDAILLEKNGRFSAARKIIDQLLDAAVLHLLNKKANTANEIHHLIEKAPQTLKEYALDEIKILYSTGTKTDKYSIDKSKDVVSILEAACEQSTGRKITKHFLGTVYLNGTNGVTKDIPTAIKFFKQSAALNFQPAIDELDKLKDFSPSELDQADSTNSVALPIKPIPIEIKDGNKGPSISINFSLAYQNILPIKNLNAKATKYMTIFK